MDIEAKEPQSPERGQLGIHINKEYFFEMSTIQICSTVWRHGAGIESDKTAKHATSPTRIENGQFCGKKYNSKLYRHYYIINLDSNDQK